MTERRPAEVFPPGEFIREELEARGWTQGELADILGRAMRDVSEIVTGKRAITPETARGLAHAFGTDAQFWLNLESAYRLAKLHPVDDSVARRARLYAAVPMKDILRRGWIEPSASVDVLESRVRRFLGVEALADTPAWMQELAARKPSYREISPAQKAWLARARDISKSAPVSAEWTPERLRDAIARLLTLRENPQDVRVVPRVLGEAGVRFVIVEPISDAKIDGACLWLDDRSPVVALSMRFDRIDAFWFTLFHELDHVMNGDGLALDIDLRNGDDAEMASLPAREVRANRHAADAVVSQRALDGFVARVHPLYSRARIEAFAKQQHVHPGLVVGQLHWQKKLPYSHHRGLLARIRASVTAAALTDGWGQPLPASA